MGVPCLQYQIPYVALKIKEFRHAISAECISMLLVQMLRDEANTEFGPRAAVHRQDLSKCRKGKF